MSGSKAGGKTLDNASLTEKLSFSGLEENLQSAKQSLDLNVPCLDRQYTSISPLSLSIEELHAWECQGKVPEGRILVHPRPGFVVKAHVTVEETVVDGRKNLQKETKKVKVFINVVNSVLIPERCHAGEVLRPPGPRKEEAANSSSRKLPAAMGRLRTEKDQHGTHVDTVDLCLHPTSITWALEERKQKEEAGGGEAGKHDGMDRVVELAMSGYLASWEHREEGGRLGEETTGKPRRRRQIVRVHREYVILKNCRYKTGRSVVPMLVEKANLLAASPKPPPSSSPALQIHTIPATAACSGTDAVGMQEGERSGIAGEEELAERKGGRGGEGRNLKGAGVEEMFEKLKLGEDSSGETRKRRESIRPDRGEKGGEGGREGGGGGVGGGGQGGGGRGGREGGAAVMTEAQTGNSSADTPLHSASPPLPLPLTYTLHEQHEREDLSGLMDAPQTRLCARFSRPNFIILKVALPSKEGECEEGMVCENWVVDVGRREVRIQSRTFRGREGKEGRRYAVVVPLPYPAVTAEEKEGAKGDRMIARVMRREGRHERTMVLKLAVEQDAGKMVVMGRAAGGKEEVEGEKEEACIKEGSRATEIGEKIREGGRNDHGRWVTPPPQSTIKVLGGSRGGDGMPKGRGSPVEAEKQGEEEERRRGKEGLASIGHSDESGGPLPSPPVDVTEEEGGCSLLVQVPDIDLSSVRLETGKKGDKAQNARLFFSSTSPSPSSTTVSWCLKLPNSHGLDRTQCMWDVANENMWVRVGRSVDADGGKAGREVMLSNPHIYAMCS
ncbi:hypothetical protein NSK_003453 [Nannochloropsis salina CCMP1776]|jgi:hypothetical protein|uniref:PIH1 N-terminal domain-containing protein n=1 Tax=Nannochloropsis salina CCMP1776 TaxID=1027361 RepID=A0A4D9D8V1_9STRA|nr:hypothetical protein NSK_003453 [Nannochloropsis salina CCMP1776]|eukprot:TFJ85029.1 hypothetical protein NSK_003453 [Nannochloropsis salina CCMP1776]